MAGGRARPDCRGEKQWKSRLTEGDVAEIVKRLKEGDRITDIAREYGVARQTVQNVKSGTAWSWLTMIGQ